MKEGELKFKKNRVSCNGISFTGVMLGYMKYLWKRITTLDSRDSIEDQNTGDSHLNRGLQQPIEAQFSKRIRTMTLLEALRGLKHHVAGDIEDQNIVAAHKYERIRTFNGHQAD